MTWPSPRADLLDAGFAFARRLSDPQFRAHLSAIGWRSGMHVVPAADSDTVGNVVRRMVVNQAPRRCLVAIPSEAERFGFRLFFVERPAA